MADEREFTDIPKLAASLNSWYVWPLSAGELTANVGVSYRDTAHFVGHRACYPAGTGLYAVAVSGGFSDVEVWVHSCMTVTIRSDTLLRERHGTKESTPEAVGSSA